MLFDPEDGMTLEQSIEFAWNNRLSPSMRADVLAVAKKTGRTRNDIILECRERFLRDLEDPEKLAAERALVEWEQTPFGKYPLLERSEP